MVARASELLGVTPAFTQHPRHAEELAVALPADASLLVVAGGDGTLSEVVNGLMLRPREQRPPVLLIPGGSGNDVARMLQLRRTPTDLERRLRQALYVDWDVMKVTLCNSTRENRIRYGINVLSTGITAEVLSIFNRMMRRLPADVGYAAAGVLALSRFRAQPMHISIDNESQTGSPLVVAVANSRWFGSGIGIAPQAIPNDGRLNLTTANEIGALGFLGLLPKLRKGLVINDSRIGYAAGQYVQLRTETPLGVEMDGEIIGFTPATIEVIPGAIRLVI